MTIVFLDTNIYRQLGINFIENNDYKNLVQILETTGNEFGLLTIVYEEIMDYYKNDLLASLFNDHETVYKRYKSISVLPDIEIPDIVNLKKQTLDKISKRLKINKLIKTLPLINNQTLLEFLLHNKRLEKKDNTRDFLIFYTLLKICKANKIDRVVLITNDKIFKTNEYFNELLKAEDIVNLTFYESIGDFFKDFGPKVEFVDEKFILKSVPKLLIKEELLNDIKCLPSYISEYYYQKLEEDTPNIETLTIKNIEVADYYIIKDYNHDKLKISFNLRVDIVAIFQPDPQIDEIREFQYRQRKSFYSNYNNQIDKEGRPVFDSNILFIFEGYIDENKRKIVDIKFIDFIPQYYLPDSLKLNTNLSNTDNGNFCIHIFDNTTGFIKKSKFGDKNTWFAQCIKCGQYFDTGEFVD